MNLKNGYKVIVVAIALPVSANAYCPSPSPFLSQSFEGQVNRHLDYLLCLHNEQVTSLNRHSDAINQIGDDVDALDRRMKEHQSASASDGTLVDRSILREVIMRYDILAEENAALRARISKLEALMEERGASDVSD